MDQLLGLVAGLHVLPLAAVLLFVLLGVLHHLVDLVPFQGGPAGDGHGLFLAGGQVLGGNVDDPVGIDVEGDFDLGHSHRGGGDAGQKEFAEALVVHGHGALTLQDMYLHRRLVALGSGKDLRPTGGDGGVSLDHLGHHRTLGLHAQGEGGDIQQQHVLHLALQHAGLDGGAGGHDFVGIHSAVGRATGESFHQLLDGGHAGGSAHQHDMVDFGSPDAGILDGR